MIPKMCVQSDKIAYIQLSVWSLLKGLAMEGVGKWSIQIKVLNLLFLGKTSSFISKHKKQQRQQYPTHAADNHQTSITVLKHNTETIILNILLQPQMDLE